MSSSAAPDAGASTPARDARASTGSSTGSSSSTDSPAAPFAFRDAAVAEHTTDQVQSVAAAEAPQSLLSDIDLHLFHEGTHTKLWKKLGAHVVPGGVMFGVWAPNAAEVSVIGDFNGWDPRANRLQVRAGSGIWEGFVPGVGKGTVYKFHITSQWNNYRVDKADPFGLRHEMAPRTASIVWDLDYEWHDDE